MTDHTSPAPGEGKAPTEVAPPDVKETPETPETPEKKKAKRRSKGKKGKPKANDQTEADAQEEKPKRPPQIHTDEEIRGMLASLQADYPGMSIKGVVKLALRQMCDKSAYLPPIRLARIDAETLRTQAGIAADVEDAAKKTIRAIIKAKLDPVTQAKLTGELEKIVAALPEERRTMLRQAAIPMTPNLPVDVQVGIVFLEHEKLACPDESSQTACDTCIQILKAYRPPEFDLPADLRDPFENEDSLE